MRSDVPPRRTTRSPTGREPYGDGASIVVVGVTTDQGGRENRLQGEGRQVFLTLMTERYARCGTPKLSSRLSRTGARWCVPPVMIAFTLANPTGVLQHDPIWTREHWRAG